MLRRDGTLDVRSRESGVFSLRSVRTGDAVHSALWDDVSALTTSADVPADVLVDDYPGNVEAFVEDGRTGALFRQPWSDSLVRDGEIDGRFVAETWSEVEAIVRREV